jgi:hypothetical protein
MTKTYLQAKKCFLISHHNQRLTEEQLGIRLSDSEVITNPVKTTRQVIPYPSTESGFRLACVARLFLLDKGQDMLIRILSHEKWKKSFEYNICYVEKIGSLACLTCTSEQHQLLRTIKQYRNNLRDHHLISLREAKVYPCR